MMILVLPLHLNCFYVFSVCALFTLGGGCIKCVLFVKSTLWINLHFHLVICCSWLCFEREPMIGRGVLFMVEENSLSAWSRRQKYGRPNRISFLVSAFLPRRDVLMGTYFCCANPRRISAGRFLSGHESGVDGRGRREREKERKGSPGYDGTWILHSSLLNLTHHRFMSTYYTYLFCMAAFACISAVVHQTDWTD